MARQGRSKRKRGGKPVAGGGGIAEVVAKPRRRRWTLGLCLLTAGLWQLCFAPFDAAPLAYVVLVPWLLVVVTAPRMRSAVLWSWVAGIVTFAVAVHWLTWMAIVGYVAVVPLLGAYWMLTAWVVRWAHQRGLGLWWVLPVVWVPLEYLRAHFLSGFPWFYLGHSQYRWVWLIQVADLGGVYPVSFFVAMVNGAVADVVCRRVRTGGWTRPVAGGAAVGRWYRVAGPGPGPVAVAVVGAAMLGYGAYRLNEWERVAEPGPRIGVVQCAYPISLHAGRFDQAEAFAEYVEQSRKLPLAELDLLSWPETMLPPNFHLDWHEIDLARRGADDRRYIETMRGMQTEIADLLAEPDAPLLAGGMTRRRRGDGDKDDPLALYNSAMLFRTGSGRQLGVDEPIYDKMHCVPFSEYVPLAESWPWLHGVLRNFVPESMPQLTPGKLPVRFPVGRGGRKWRVVTPICYEGTIARVCRRLCHDEDGEKQADCIVNISNDGWFIFPWGSRWASTELDQHLATYAFRAIENRVPVARAVNTGVSGFISSAGRIEQIVVDPRTGRRKMISGVAERQVLVDERVSVYSQIGDLPVQVCSVAGVVLLAVMWRRKRRESSKGMAK